MSKANATITQGQNEMVWKVASRWSDTGHAASSILDIFRNYNVVFVGRGTELFGKVSVGDLLVITDGYRVVALGAVTGAPQPLPELAIEFTAGELQRFNCEPWVWGCRIDYVNVTGGGEEPEDYRRRGAFHAIHDRAADFRQLYHDHRQRFEEGNQFEIAARTCTLIKNIERPGEVLWQKNLRFQVPIYQRPYSWGESQIRKLVNDLLGGFHGRNGCRAGEPLFIGTMQLSWKMPYDGSPGIGLHEIIDGQQRLSTLILLLKVLRDHAEEESLLPGVDLAQQLETRVSSDQQQRYWSEALAADSTQPIPPGQNRYLAGLSAIVLALQTFEEEETPGHGVELSASPWTAGFPFRSFIEYLSTKVYFVIIETKASLSKSLQIFDAINTAGMDLNGGDVFKVRYYEYLRKVTKAPESVFQEIDALYESIDRNNKNLGRSLPTHQVTTILTLAQQMLIPRHGLSAALHDLAAATFFERLFDVVLQVNQWPNFSPLDVGKVRIGLDDLNRLVDTLFEWERVIPSLGKEARCALRFIATSRYGKYWFLPVLFRFRFGTNRQETERFVIQLSKLLVLLSIWKKKALYEGHSIMHDLLKHLFNPTALQTPDEVITFLHQSAVRKRTDLIWALKHCPIADNAKSKNLACRLSAMLTELEAVPDPEKDLAALLFDTAIDIEHIESVNHQDHAARTATQQAWGANLHKLGNLMILEYSINRSLQNKPYSIKRESYLQSRFLVSQSQSDHNVWNLEEFQNRHLRELFRIANYLCQMSD